MKKATSFLLAVVLTGCGQYEGPEQAAIPTGEELTADPGRLKELRQQCKTDRSRLGDVLCSRASEATRRRFYGDGSTPYTPQKEPPKF